MHYTGDMLCTFFDNIIQKNFQQLLPATASEGQAAQVNGLYFQALGEFVKLPFDLVADNWRFNIFEGKTNKDTWNDDWWRLRFINFSINSLAYRARKAVFN